MAVLPTKYRSINGKRTGIADSSRPAKVEKPLRFIERQCRVYNSNHQLIGHKDDYFDAKQCAKDGDGAGVQRIAMDLL